MIGSMLLHAAALAIVAALVVEPLFTPPLLALGLVILIVLGLGVAKGVRGAKGIAPFLIGLVLDVVMATILLTLLDWRLGLTPTTTPSFPNFAKHLTFLQPTSAILFYFGLPVIALASSSLGISLGLLIIRRRGAGCAS